MDDFPCKARQVQSRRMYVVPAHKQGHLLLKTIFCISAGPNPMHFPPI
jgi:hypothetical protein